MILGDYRDSLSYFQEKLKKIAKSTKDLYISVDFLDEAILWTMIG